MDVRLKSEKEELLDKKIEEVRKRNEARLKKFQEAEEDRKRAEKAGCAVNMKKSTFDEEDYYTPKHRGPQKSQQHHKTENRHKPKKYTPGTSEEWTEYIGAKNKNNTERERSEEYNNNNNDSFSNENLNNSNNNFKKERPHKSNNRAIYVPKHLQNRESPEIVKPPPPDPRNSFLADSYRTPPQVDNAEESHPLEPKKQPTISPATPPSSQNTFHGDARQRIIQLKLQRNQDQSPSPDLPTLTNLPISTHLTTPNHRPTRTDIHRPHSHQKNKPNSFKPSRQIPPADSRDGKGWELADKPIKSILKKPKQPNINELDDSQPIIAVITTPGDDDDVNEGEGAQGYSRKKEEAICDWLKKSEFDSVEGGSADDDDEWEDVEDGEDEVEESATNKNIIIINTKQDHRGEDDELEAFEEDNASFQNFIKQHTLTLDGDYEGFDWASEMERVSLENKHKIDLEAVENSTLKE